MKRAVVALLVSMSMLGCFPHNARHRTYAKYAEGASLLAGIGISAFANTGADCDEQAMAGIETSCRTTAKWLSTAGVVLILGGLLGFVATVSTAEEAEDTKAAKEIEIRVQEQQKPAEDKPAAKDRTEPAGSASPSPAAPQS